eukprot:9042537-Lingulodinium_polyedra.AAC.1
MKTDRAPIPGSSRQLQAIPGNSQQFHAVPGDSQQFQETPGSTQHPGGCDMRGGGPRPPSLRQQRPQ